MSRRTSEPFVALDGCRHKDTYVRAMLVSLPMLDGEVVDRPVPLALLKADVPIDYGGGEFTLVVLARFAQKFPDHEWRPYDG